MYALVSAITSFHNVLFDEKVDNICFVKTGFMIFRKLEWYTS